MDDAAGSGTGVDVAITRARMLPSSSVTEERMSGWALIGELCNGHPENVSAAWPLAQPSIERERESEVLPGALWALGAMHIHEALPAVLSHSKSAAPTVRLAAAREVPSCAGDPADERAAQALVTLTADTEDDVRDWATFGLGAQLRVDTAEVRDISRRAWTIPMTIRAPRRWSASQSVATGVPSPPCWPSSPQVAWGCAVEAAKLLADDRLPEALIELRGWWDLKPALLEEAIR